GFCANLVDLPTTTRTITVDGLPGGHSCRFDPNRVFTPAGIAGSAFAGSGCSAADAAAAVPQVSAWGNQVLWRAIGRCRAATGDDAQLPVIAFHNNAVPAKG